MISLTEALWKITWRVSFKAKNNSFQLTFYVLIGEKPDKLTLKCEFSAQSTVEGVFQVCTFNCTLLYFTAACSEATSCQVMIRHAERKRSSSTFEPGKWMFQRGKMCNTHSHFHSQRWVLYLISNFHQPPWVWVTSVFLLIWKADVWLSCRWTLLQCGTDSRFWRKRQQRDWGWKIPNNKKKPTIYSKQQTIQ